MSTSLKILTAVIVVIAAVLGWFGIDALNAILPRGVALIIDFVAAGIGVYYFLRWIITEAVASGVEKGIKAVLTNSNIVRNEISAAITEERESQSQEDEE